MDSGYYAAMTGLIARTQALDIAATNLANAQTPDTLEQEYFRSALMGPDARTHSWADGEQLRPFGGDRLNLEQGSLDPTGNPLDLAIEGKLLSDSDAQRSALHRDGSFHRAPEA